MVQKIGNATDIIGILENGDLASDLGEHIREALHALRQEAGEKNKAKGSVSLKLEFEVEGEKCEIRGEITAKLPKRVRPRSFLFVTDAGELSREHPRQHDMFPRPVSRAAGQD